MQIDRDSNPIHHSSHHQVAGRDGIAAGDDVAHAAGDDVVGPNGFDSVDTNPLDARKWFIFSLKIYISHLNAF